MKQQYINTNTCNVSGEATDDYLVMESVSEFHIGRSLKALQAIWRRPAYQNGLKINVIIDKNLNNTLLMDSLKIQYCLNNLISNAVKYSEKGIITVSAVRLNTHTGMSYLALNVQDPGEGMSKQQVLKLFECHSLDNTSTPTPYGTVDTSLRMTKSIIEAMNGKILVKSETGKGSTFALLIPLDEAEISETPTPIQANHNLQSPHAGLNIMIVDDYHLNQLTIKTLLHESVHKIYFASNGFEAIEVLHSCTIDVILMDIHMPVLDGIEATLKIRSSNETWADVTIIALTADPHYQHADICRKIGMDDALAKPIRKTDLLKALDNAAGQNRLENAS
jgi:CheY-like chemotaxis protein